MTVDEVYSMIGKSIIDSANNYEWAKGILKLEVLEGMTGYNLTFFDENEIKRSAKFKKHPEMSHYIHELHAITTEGGHNRWNRAVFTLFPDGKFDMQFIWDQELHDEVERLNNE